MNEFIYIFDNNEWRKALQQLFAGDRFKENGDPTDFKGGWVS